MLNGAAVGTTSLSARALLERLLAIEHDFGRTRPYGGAPRTLDLDSILYGDAVIDEQGWSFRIRAFGSGGSCWSRWRRLRRIGLIR